MMPHARSIYDGMNDIANGMDSSRGKGNNLGEQWGKSFAESVKPGFDFVREKIKNPLDDLANVVTGYEKSLETEKQRNERWLEIIANESQKQTAILRQSFANGNGPSPNVQQALGYLAAAISEQQGRAMLSRR